MPSVTSLRSKSARRSTKKKTNRSKQSEQRKTRNKSLDPTPGLFRDFFRASKAPRLRTIRQFAEDVIVIPEGRYAGRKFRIARAPWAGHFFDAVDSGKWNRFASLGPVQSGKTLNCVIVPLLYHLFEVRETVIFGVPSMDMAFDKYQREVLPVIQASPDLRKFLPDHGRGSRGGRFESITFTNGCTLKFMSSGGGDDKRSAFTARCVVVTECDKMDEAGESSREADPISQLEARTASFAHDKRIYLECTVSVEEGRIWREYNESTQTRIVVECLHCGEKMTPEREHLVGFQDADNELVAASDASFFCRECGEAWTDAEREQLNLASHVVFGEEHTDEPRLTNTFGFRWNAFNNLFWPAGWIAGKEWQRQRAIDEDNAERELRQFVWALPAEPNKFDLVDLKADALAETRQVELGRGICPHDTEHLTLGIDLGLHTAHYVAIAWRPNVIGHVVEYGVIDVPGRDMGPERAIMTALLSFRDEHIVNGWARHQGDKLIWPTCVLIDAGYQPDSVYAFCRKAAKDDPKHPKRFLPALGRGTSQTKSVAAPAATIAGKLVHRGDFYEIKRFAEKGVYCVIANSDAWKSRVHQRLAAPTGEPGSLLLHHVVNAREHLTFTKHLTNEKVVQEYVPGKGIVDKWVNESRRPNHYFDSTYLACVAADICGVRDDRDNTSMVSSAKQPTAPRGLVLDDGRPFFVTERSG